MNRHLTFLLLLFCCSQSLFSQPEKTQLERLIPRFDSLYKAGDLAGGLTLCETASELARNAEPIFQAQVGFHCGQFLYLAGNYEAAIERLDSANAIFQSLGKYLHSADCLHYLGNSTWYLQGAAAAMPYFEEALLLFDEHPDSTWLNQGDYPNTLGYALAETGEFERAFLLLQRGLAARRRLAGEQSNKVLDSYNTFGTFYMYREDYFNAAREFEKGLAVGKAIYEKQPNHPNLGSLYANLGVLHGNMGDFPGSIRYLEIAKAIFETGLAENEGYLIRTNNALANSYYFLGNLKKTRACLDWVNQRREQLDPYAAIYNLGVEAFYAQATKDYQAAKNFSEQALRLTGEHLGESAPDYRTCLENLGNACIHLRQFDQALDLYNQSYQLRIQQETTPPASLARTLTHIGSALDGLGRYAEADSFEQKAQALLRFDGNFSSVNAPREFLTLHWNRALSKARQADLERQPALLDSAAWHMNLLVGYLDHLRLNYAEDESKKYLGQENYVIYENAIDLYFRSGKPDLHEKAFPFFEKAKSYLLLEALRQAKTVGAAAADSIRYFRLNINNLNEKISREEDAPSDAAGLHVGYLKTQRFLLEDSLRLLVKRLEASEPKYLKARWDTSVDSVASVRKDLLAPGQCLLEYLVGDSNIFIFLLRHDTFELHKIRRDFDLDSLVEQLRFGLSGYHPLKVKPDGLYPKTVKAYVAAASELYERLVAPVAGRLEKRVILAPDGSLSMIPFEALLVKKPAADSAFSFHRHRYLGLERSLSYCYSATLLREMRLGNVGGAKAGLPFAGFAPFIVKGATMRGTDEPASETSRYDYLPLEFSGEEVQEISQMMGGGKVFKNRLATLDAFREAAPDANVLHCATHANADLQAGLFSHLLLADSLGNAVPLRLGDLYNFKFRCDLAVLSACVTGIGKFQRGEGVISLARAFAYAGAKSVVTSLWSVGDKSTKDLMVAFYGQLSTKHLPKDVALQSARQGMVNGRSKEKAHPYYWAGFVLIGNSAGLGGE